MAGTRKATLRRGADLVGVADPAARERRQAAEQEQAAGDEADRRPVAAAVGDAGPVGGRAQVLLGAASAADSATDACMSRCAASRASAERGASLCTTGACMSIGAA
jgi:hypothetical protein